MDIQRQIRLPLKTLTIIFVLLAALTFASTHFQPAHAAINDSLITIQPDGSVEGTIKIRVDGNVYTLTGDISGSPGNGAYLISVKKDGVTLDGQGHRLLGSGTGVAIQLEGRNDVVVKNLVIDNFGVGIEVDAEFVHGETVTDGDTVVNSTNNQILKNQITSVYDGIAMTSAYGNLVKANTITSPVSSFCIRVNFGEGNNVVDNQLFGGGIGLFKPKQNSFHGNTVDGKPIVILDGASGQVVDGAAQVLLFNCQDMTVRNVNPTSDLAVAVGFYNTQGSQILNCKGNIVLENSNGNTITKNQLTSTIKLYVSHNNNLTQNTLTSSKEDYAINLEFCLDNNIQANTISAFGKTGIGLFSSNDNYIHGNLFYDSASAITLTYTQFKSIGEADWATTSLGNHVFANNISDCTNGITLKGANNNKVYANNIAECSDLGVNLYLANGNAFYHNNFLNNAKDVYEKHDYLDRMQGGYVTYYSANNTWDDGYPSGGNYWSSYNGADADGDGIGDTAYVAFENHTDNYPLMAPFTIRDSNIHPAAQEPTNPQSTQPTQEKQDPLPTTVIVTLAATVVLVCVCLGLLVYVKKIKRPKAPSTLL